MHTARTIMMARLKKILGQIIGVALLFGFFAGLIAVVFVPVEMNKMAEAQTWPSRPGVITQSSASEVFSRRRGNHWAYVIRGTFTDTGEPFVITQVRYGEFSPGRSKPRSLDTVARYPSGSAVRVFYSPAQPRNMILEPFAPLDEMCLVMGIGIGLVLLPAVLFAFRKRFR